MFGFDHINIKKHNSSVSRVVMVAGPAREAALGGRVRVYSFCRATKKAQRVKAELSMVGHTAKQRSCVQNNKKCPKQNPSVSAGVMMVGTTGIEPVTSSMSTRRSPAELRAQLFCVLTTKIWLGNADF